MSKEVAFGAWLKQWRKDQGIGSDAMSERIGCSTIALYKIESGDRKPSRQVALLLAEILGVPNDEQETFIAFARSGQVGVPPANGSAPATAPPAAVAPSPEAGSSPWRTARRYKTNLPHSLTHLIGRDKEVEEGRGLLLQTRVRLLTLTGPPGIGKTRLATEIAAQMLENFDDGVFLVELAAIDDPDLILPGIARVLGLKESGEQPIEETLTGFLQERRILLLLDNFEHLLDAAPALARLMESSPWLKVLTTSREALHLRGERRYVVPPLAVPNVKGSITVEEMLKQPSAALFAERAAEADANFELTEENVADVAVIVSRLEGVPLAIELAAARAAQLSPRQMQTSMKSRLALGRAGARDLPPRQRTLLSSIEWSYNLLNEEEQKVFRSLGVFGGGFTPSAIEAIHREDGEQERMSEIADVLYSLASKNLIRLHKRGMVDDADNEDRYVLLEAIREYALHTLGGSAEEGHVRKRHALYYLSLAEQAHLNQTGPRQLPLLLRMDDDYSNAISGLGWLMSNGRSNVGIADNTALMASYLFYYWDWRGYFTEGREWMTHALALGDRLLWNRTPGDGATYKADPRLLQIEGRLLNGLGLLAWNQGDHAEALRYFKRGLQVQTERKFKRGVGATLNNIAILEAEQGKYAQAIKTYHKVLDIDDELGDGRNPLTLNNLGVAYWDSGDVEKARSMYEESLDVFRQVDDPGNMVLALDNLGIVAEYDGDYAAANRYLQEAVAICRTLGYNNNLAHVLANMASTAISEGDIDAAKEYYREVLPMSQQQGFNQIIFGCLEGIARLCVMQQRYSEAAKLWGAAERMREHSKHPMSPITMSRYKQNVALAKSSMKREPFQEAWSAGRAMSVQAAVDFGMAQLA